jgi:D-aminopeptidase
MTTQRCRARELGLEFDGSPAGPHNAITDVPGVLVGHFTLTCGEGVSEIGSGPFRTGITAIMPAPPADLITNKMQAATHVINGFGKSVGLMQVDEMATIETPILITSTLNVGKVADGLLEYLIGAEGLHWPSINPIVMECNDFFLSDALARPLGKDEVAEAIAAASDGQVAEGAIGAGMGTSAYGYKGGVGTASRLIECDGQNFSMGALVVTNMGGRADLTIKGVHVGRKLKEEKQAVRDPGGSIIMVIATDAPLSETQLRRIALRATHGLARTGTYSADNSGDIVLAFSTTRRLPVAPAEPVFELREVANAHINSFFAASADVIEESILNAMFMAETIVGRDGNRLRALPLDRTKSILGL